MNMTAIDVEESMEFVWGRDYFDVQGVKK